jgi:peptidoglycan/LPS O-acetylase OafA/YrhL
MESKKEYFKVLDVLRVWAAIEILLFHAQLAGFYHLRAYVFADFFFILSGFILFKNDFALDTFSIDVFIKKRFFRLYPLHLATTIAILLHFLFIARNIPNFQDGTSYTFFNYIFFLQGLGFRKISDGDWNFPSWAISVEFWSNIIFALFLRNKQKMTYIFLAILGYLVIYTIEGNLNTFTYNYFGFLNSGMVRGLAGICLGAYLAKVNFQKNVKVGPYLWTLAEILSIAGLVLLLTIGQSPSFKFADFLSIPLFALMILYFSEAQGFISKFVVKIRIHKLAVYAFASYLVHIPALKIIYEVFKVSGKYQVPVYIAVVMILSFISHHFIEKPFRKLGVGEEKINSYWVLSILIMLLVVAGLTAKLFS